MRSAISILFLSGFAFLLSCQSDYDFGIDTSSQIIVNGLFQPDSNWIIGIYKTPNSLWDYKFLPVDNAEVSISVGNFKFPLIQKSEGLITFYTSESEDVPSLINQNFTLEAHKDEQLISATSYIPAMPQYSWVVEEYKVERFDMDPSDSYFDLLIDVLISISFDFEDDQNRFFNIVARYRPNSIYSQMYSDSVYDNIKTTIEFPSAFSSIRISDGDFVDLRTQSDATKLLVKVQGSLRHTKVDHCSIYLIVSSITPDYFSYQKKTLDQYIASQDLFSEPVQIPGNIEGGLGIFSGINSKVELIEIKPSVFK